MSVRNKIPEISYYNITDPKLSTRFKEAMINNEKFINEHFPNHLKLLWKIVDLEYEIACHYIPFSFGFTNVSEIHSMLFSCFHKNLINISTVIDLIRVGLYGPSRIIMRQVFELLMITKFSSISDDINVYNKWINGESIYFANGILKKIKKPCSYIFEEFWEIMCKYSHSTIYASQIAFEANHHLKEIDTSLTFLEILLECNYHILISHLINSSMMYCQNDLTNFLWTLNLINLIYLKRCSNDETIRQSLPPRSGTAGFNP